MNKDLFAGRATIHRDPHDVEGFEAIHSLLQSTHEDLTLERLCKKRTHTAAAYLLHYVDTSFLAAGQVELLAFNHVVSSMAEEHLDIHLGRSRSRESYFGLGWVPYSMASLERELANNPFAEQIRSESIFFSPDGLQLRRLGQAALAAVEPQGAYSHYAFAAGVAYELVAPAVPSS